ncbi:MAG TPA: DnaJ domain-containing protein [Myxococcaceae bacterium]|nr:DnaJ domain-containing protein [Myxococcaceae bacterium]
MKGMQAETPQTAAAPLAVECTHCGVAMSERSGVASQVRYFRCPSCGRWFSSMYAEIFRSDAKIRVLGGRPAALKDSNFDAVKQRLEEWLTQLESQDPYRVLGISPRDSAENVKSRYRQLALERHPDRGGSVESMKELNLAYGRIASREDQNPPAPERGRVAPSPRAVRKR